MVHQDSLLVTLVKLVDRLPMPVAAAKRGRGRPIFYPNGTFLKAVVIMIVRHLHTVHELLAVLDQPTDEMAALRALLSEQGCFPSHLGTTLESRPSEVARTDWVRRPPSNLPGSALAHDRTCGGHR